MMKSASVIRVRGPSACAGITPSPGWGTLGPTNRATGQRLFPTVGEDDRQEYSDLQDSQHRVHRHSFDPTAFTPIRHLVGPR